jgi:hypothetical protein
MQQAANDLSQACSMAPEDQGLAEDLRRVSAHFSKETSGARSDPTEPFIKEAIKA